ncbi:MAG: site-2 protease family protein [Erysipelotrichaceae bacterium]|nr:site-2 protease family protein [Erysipelotrichaceae bacterium]
MIVFAFSLSNIGTIILFALMICFLIAWHELGHLFVAKKCNVYCYEYSIGFGPALYQNKKHETHFCLRAIPFGGYVKMAGEEGVEEGNELKDNSGNPIPSNRILANQSCGKRALVLAAGGIMNVIFALVCFYVVLVANNGFAIALRTNEVSVVETVDDAGNHSILYDQGMESGDKIITIKTRLNEQGASDDEVTYEIDKYEEIVKALDSKKPTKDGGVQTITITFEDVSDNNQIKEVTVSRQMSTVIDENGQSSLVLSKIGLSQAYKVYQYNALTSLYGTFHFMGYYTVEICRAFGKMFVGDFSGLSGLVGIYGTIDSVATDTSVSFLTRLINVIYVSGALSFSLGFFNLIPFPALDGGRLVFVALEAIRKKKINPELEGKIHTIGLFILMALMIIVNIRDIFNLF